MIRHLFDKTLHVSQLPRVATRVAVINGKTFVTGDLLEQPVEVREGDRVLTGLIPLSPSTFRCYALLYGQGVPERAMAEAVASAAPIAGEQRAVAQEKARGVVLIRRGRGRPRMTEEERERRAREREAARYDESAPITDWMGEK